MSKTDPSDDDASADSGHEDNAENKPSPETRPKEIGGRNGPDPTRFGDWEKGGRCIDF